MRASAGGSATANCHWSARVPDGPSASAHASHHGVTLRASGSMTSSAHEAAGGVERIRRSRSRESGAKLVDAPGEEEGGAVVLARAAGAAGGLDEVAAARRAMEAERAPCPGGLGQRPAAFVESGDGRGGRLLERPRCGRRAGAAAEIENAVESNRRWRRRTRARPRASSGNAAGRSRRRRPRACRPNRGANGRRDRRVARRSGRRARAPLSGILRT